MSVNKVILVGNVGADPEVKRLESGNVVAKITIATSEKYVNKNGEKVENTEWHNVVFWGKLAEVLENYIKKGSQLYVEGKLSTRSWADKDGNKRYTTEIIGNNMQMLGGKKQAENKDNSQATGHSDNEQDDLPF